MIPDAYDPKAFYPPRKDVRQRDLIFVGRLVPEKECEVFLRTIELPNRSERAVRSTTAVGKGPLSAELAAGCTSKRLNGCDISFTGKLPTERATEKMRRHRASAIPSLLEESFGLTAREGMAYRDPVVSPDCNGLPEVLGGCGLCAKSDNCERKASSGKWRMEPQTGEAHLSRYISEALFNACMEALES